LSWVKIFPLTIAAGGDGKQSGFTKISNELGNLYTVISTLFSVTGHMHTGVDQDGPVIPIAGGGTGAITAAGALAALGGAPLASPSFTGILAIAGQIQFPATQNPSSDPNVLDDYEEGTFTPSLNFSGGTTGITYNNRSGRYVKIGNLVHVSININLSSKGTSTGNANISGLPFVTNSIDNTGTIAGYYHEMVGLTSPPMASAGGGNASLILSFSTTTYWLYLSDGYFLNDSVFNFAFTYTL